MLSHAQTIINGSVTTGSKQARRLPNFIGVHAQFIGQGLWGILWLSNKITPQHKRIPLAAFFNKIFLDQTFCHHHMG